VGRTPHAGTDAGRYTGLDAGLGLPVELISSLDDAFASEVAVRLPRMFGATARLQTGANDAANEILSDSHALASSASVVGEDVAAYAARECEELLLGFIHSGPGPHAVKLIVGAVDALGLALARWINPSPPVSSFPFVPQQFVGRA
jgi:hypothetical protein